MNYVVIGGTGTLGSELMRQIRKREPNRQIVCFSRDEQKQQDMKREFPGVRFVIGDIRDGAGLRRALRDAHTVFHCAAMKHIDTCEANPLEAIKTNLTGTLNVAEMAMIQKVPFVVYSNTDKAVLPITTYGYTKALAQNCIFHLSNNDTRFSAFNWGNILASRGSVLFTFVESLLTRGVVNITDHRMSRFWMRIEDAASFMLDNYRTAPDYRALIPPVRGALVTRIADSCARILGIESFKVTITGLRGTEKLYEVLESTHGGCVRSDSCPQYSDDDLDNMMRDIVLRLASDVGTRMTA